MRKNSHGRILEGEPKEQHLNTVPKSCSFFTIQLIFATIHESHCTFWYYS